MLMFLDKLEGGWLFTFKQTATIYMYAIALQVAELVSCLKRTMSRVLIMIVSVGYGVVKPRLGSTLIQVILVGFVYFTFCAVEGLARVSKARKSFLIKSQRGA